MEVARPQSRSLVCPGTMRNDVFVTRLAAKARASSPNWPSRVAERDGLLIRASATRPVASPG